MKIINNLIKLLKILKYHLGYYRLTIRFTKLDLPKLTKDEKRQIRETWPGVHIYDMDFVHARLFKKIHGFSPYYLSPCWYNEMRAFFNPARQLYSLENKALCDVYFPAIKFPEVYVRCLNGSFFDKEMHYLTKDEAKAILREKGVFVIKPAIGSEQGDRVEKITVSATTNLDEVFRTTGKDFIAQALVKQAPEIERLNPSSLNCFRVTTMYFNGKFDYSTALKVGKKGAFRDNWNSAYWINVKKDGTLSQYGYDYNVNPVDRSDAGVILEGQQMPLFDKMIARLEEWHKGLFANCCVIGWDVTIDSNYEVCVIENNLWDPGTNIEQFVSGDFFKPFRDDMINFLRK